MKNIFKLFIAIFCLAACSSTLEASCKKFVILIASYNNKKYVKKNIFSALQDYPEECYRIIYIDDCSTDTTYELAQDIIAIINKPGLFTLIHNEINMGAQYNHWYAINNLIEDDEIVVILDGDDLLAGDFVLNHLNALYSNHDIWLTYGQYQEINSCKIGFNKPMPEYIIKQNAFRKWQDIPSHLRTFYAKLYKKINVSDLKYNGTFLTMCCDMATMIPMIEMARDHFLFIPEVLYFYNDKNPISDHKKSRKVQIEIDKYIRSLPVYQPLEKLFY